MMLRHLTSKMPYGDAEEIPLCQHFRTQRVETPDGVSERNSTCTDKIPLVTKGANSKGSRLRRGNSFFSHHITKYLEHHFQSYRKKFGHTARETPCT